MYFVQAIIKCLNVESMLEFCGHIHSSSMYDGNMEAGSNSMHIVADHSIGHISQIRASGGWSSSRSCP